MTENDKGFPDNTPITEMTAEQQAAYYKHYSRKHEDSVKAYGGITPEQVKAMQDRITEMETQQLSADQKAVKDAADKAAAEARQDADKSWSEKFNQERSARQADQLARHAGTVLKDEDQLKSFLEYTDPAKFLGDDGNVAQDKVIGHLTGLFGTTQQATPQWGQSGARPPAPSARDQGLAEARRRGYITDKE